MNNFNSSITRIRWVDFIGGQQREMVRKNISEETILGLAEEVADLSISKDEIGARAEVMESIMKNIASLRDLPLKEVEPALTYKPIEPKKG